MLSFALAVAALPLCFALPAKRSIGSAVAPFMGTASNYTVLTQTGIAAVPAMTVIGQMGIAPAAQTFITGFSLANSDDMSYATSYQVSERIYSADSTASPSPLASKDMVGAYTTAMNQNNADYRELYSGSLNNATLYPGLYTWSTAVFLSAGQNVTLIGAPCDTYIFQASEDFSFAAGSQVLLQGGITSDRVFWVGATRLIIGNGVNFAGTVLVHKNVAVGAGASIVGNVFSQTEAAFQKGVTVTPSIGRFAGCPQ